MHPNLIRNRKARFIHSQMAPSPTSFINSMICEILPEMFERTGDEGERFVGNNSRTNN